MLVNANNLPRSLSDIELSKIMFDRNISGSMQNIRDAVVQILNLYETTKANASEAKE